MLVTPPDSLDTTKLFAELDEHGYARLGRVLSAEGVAQLGSRLDDLMLGRLKYEGMFFQRDSGTGRYEDLAYGRGWQGATLAYRKLEKLELDPLFRAWIENPLFERIARARIEGAISLYRAVVFTKAVTGGTALPWHQDGGVFWGVDQAPTLQIWTALDDAPVESGCVEVIPGSHHRGLATPEGGTIPDRLVEEDVREKRVLPLPAKAGEAILIHNRVWHRSGVNTTGVRRSALSVCYMSAATKCLRKRRAPREFMRLFENH